MSLEPNNTVDEINVREAWHQHAGPRNLAGTGEECGRTSTASRARL